MIKLSPSAANRWMTCTASLFMESPFAEVSSSYANLGTLIHLYVQQSLEDRFYGIPFDEQKVKKFAKKLDVEYDVNKCDVYAGKMNRHISSLMRKNDIKKELKVLLTEFSFSKDVSKNFYLKGTADCVCVINDELHIIDLKTGFYRVDAADNRQLMIYAALALEFFREYSDTKIKSCQLHIVQPNEQGDSSNSVHVELSVLKSFFKQIKRIARNELDTGEVRFSPSQDACRYCDHIFYCNQAIKTQTDIVKEYAAESLSPDKLEQLLEMAKQAQDLSKRYVSDITTMVRNGAPIKGYQLKVGRSSRVWRDTKRVIKLLKQSIYKEEEYLLDRRLKSPNQVEKNCTEISFKGMTDTTVGAPSLHKSVEGKDTFDDHAGQVARRIFNVKEVKKDG